MRDSGPGKGMSLGQKYLASGLKFGGAIVVFALAGVALDRWLGLTPLFTIVLTLGGAALSFFSVYREITTDRDIDSDGPSGKW